MPPKPIPIFEYDEVLGANKWHTPTEATVLRAKRNPAPGPKSWSVNQGWTPSSANGMMGNTAINEELTETLRAPTQPEISGRTESTNNSGCVHARSFSETRRTRNRRLSHYEPPRRGTLNFDPKEVTADARHTAPFMTGLMRRQLHPTRSTPELRGSNHGRPHVQGQMPDCVAFANEHQISSIGGYTGHNRGRIAEGIYGSSYMHDNEVAAMAVDNRRPMSSYQQTTQVTGKLKSTGPWQASAAGSWIKACHGLTHQEGRRGEIFRERLRASEDIKIEFLQTKAVRDAGVLRTWAANLPHLEKNHAPWRTGCLGYKGFQPYWDEDRRFFDKIELGKVHPPYLPRVTFNAVVQPVATPKGH